MITGGWVAGSLLLGPLGGLGVAWLASGFLEEKEPELTDERKEQIVRDAVGRYNASGDEVPEQFVGMFKAHGYSQVPSVLDPSKLVWMKK